MFYVVKDNKLYEWGDVVSNAWNCPAEAKELKDVDLAFFDAHMENFEVQDGVLVDISGTEKFAAAKLAKQNETKIAEIKSKLDALDLKCIRAIREGGNDEDGVAFLDKYQQEINTLREELNTLE